MSFYNMKNIAVKMLLIKLINQFSKLNRYYIIMYKQQRKNLLNSDRYFLIMIQWGLQTGYIVSSNYLTVIYSHVHSRKQLLWQFYPSEPPEIMRINEQSIVKCYAIKCKCCSSFHLLMDLIVKELYIYQLLQKLIFTGKCNKKVCNSG